MQQAGCEDAVERGAEKNSEQNARYLHGDPPVDRPLAGDGRKSKVGRIHSRVERGPKKIASKMHAICTVTRLRIGLWRVMEGNQKWEESILVRMSENHPL